MTGGRKLLQQKNYPYYPNSANEALAILAITRQGLQAVFALVHWFINTNQYIVSTIAWLVSYFMAGLMPLLLHANSTPNP